MLLYVYQHPGMLELRRCAKAQWLLAYLNDTNFIPLGCELGSLQGCGHFRWEGSISQAADMGGIHISTLIGLLFLQVQKTEVFRRKL